MFDKPVRYVGYGLKERASLPRLVKTLAEAIGDASLYLGIFPLEIKDGILAAMSRDSLPEYMFAPGLSHDEATSILRQLLSVTNVTQQSIFWNRSDAAWNLLVHRQMLQLALSDIPDAMPELVARWSTLSLPSPRSQTARSMMPWNVYGKTYH
ncbi:hypothetical protein VTI74DRAFT_8891 [Chaetomium olivicolor]